MAYLNINGVTIPVAVEDKLRQEYRDDNMDEEYSEGGVLLRVRGDYKKRWSFKTIPLTKTLADPLKDILNGGGQNFSLNNTIYSSKGKALTLSRASVKYDNSGVSHASGVQCDEASQFSGERCVGVHRGCTNLLTDNEASIETSTAGWTTTGAGTTTLTQDATQYWHGAKSLKVVTDGSAASQGAGSAALTTVTVSLKYTASAWVKGTAGQNLSIVLLEYTAASAYVGETQTTFTATGSWQRVQVSRTFGATGARAKIYIGNNGTYAYTYYIDGVQLERTYFNEGATPWTLPSVVRANEFLYSGYDYSYLNGFSVSMWVYVTSQMKSYATNYTPALFSLWCNSGGTPHYFYHLYHSQGTANWVNFHNDGSSSTFSYMSDTYTTSDAWNHIRVSYDYNNATIKVYINNTLRLTITSVYKPATSKDGFQVRIGNHLTAHSASPYLYADTYYADVQIIGHPTDDSWLSPTTFSSSLYPYLKAYGTMVDATSAAPITCLAKMVGSKMVFAGREVKEEIEVELWEI